MAKPTNTVPAVDPSLLIPEAFDTTALTKQERRGVDQRAILKHMEAAAAVAELADTNSNKPFKVTLQGGTVVERH